jgi:hypothetical protein
MKGLIIASIIALVFWPRPLNDSAVADVHWLKFKSEVLSREIDALKSKLQQHREVLETAQTVIDCESGGIHDVWGDKDRPYSSYGVAQFQKRTFDELAKKATMSDLDWKNPTHQVRLLIWAIRSRTAFTKTTTNLPASKNPCPDHRMRERDHNCHSHTEMNGRKNTKRRYIQPGPRNLEPTKMVGHPAFRIVVFICMGSCYLPA